MTQDFVIQMANVVYIFKMKGVDGEDVDSSMAFPSHVDSELAVKFIREYVKKLTGAQPNITDVRHCVISTPRNICN